jgi:Ca-activated chloride channel family protein
VEIVMSLFDGVPSLMVGRPAWLLLLASLPLLGLGLRRSLVAFPARQMRVSLALRIVLVLLLALALSDIQLVHPTRKPFVTFAIDRSLSVDPDSYPRTLQYIREATTRADDKDWVWFEFASTPGRIRTPSALERMSEEFKAATLEEESVVGRDKDVRGTQSATNLQQVVEASAALCPTGRTPRLVLFTDGLETEGNVRQASDRTGVGVYPVALPPRSTAAPQMTALNTPETVAAGEPFRIELVVTASQSMEATIELFRGDVRIISEARRLDAGINKFEFSDQIEAAAEYTARVVRVSQTPSSPEELAPDGAEELPRDNIASAVVHTTGAPRVLLLEDNPERGQQLLWALEAEGIQLEIRSSSAIPNELADLQTFDVVAISNVAATDFSPLQMELLRTYVADLGGGLVMLGSEQSFGLGGYYRTPIEELLPVRSDFEKENEKPGLGLVLIIDRSGSMGGPKIALARQAARGAVELLNEQDQIGVLVFDGTTAWVSPLLPLKDKDSVMNRIASIRADGGTALYPAMTSALDALQSASARLKHVIILTDGYSTPGDFDDVTSRMAAARITVSTVGIGDADQDLLERIAQLGGGRYYFTDDPSSIPQIFARETITAGKSAINEEPFLPQLIRATPVLDGIDFDSAPFLLGYVATRAKPTSEVILATENGDPLLSWWRYGLGMTAAFTSDASGRWSAEWTAWQDFGPFWAQLFRHWMRQTGSSQQFGMTLTRRGQQTHVLLDATDLLGRFVNDSELSLNVIDPNMVARQYPLQQTAPGRYERTLETSNQGTWTFQLTAGDSRQSLAEFTRSIVVGYPDELKLRAVNEALLEDLATRSGGRLNPQPEDVFLPDQTRRAVQLTPLWPWLLVTVVMLFVADVALRRLELPHLFGGTAEQGVG